MTLQKLPNLALFVFVDDLGTLETATVWQKQFQKVELGGGMLRKGTVLEHIAQACKEGKAWKRGSFGSSGEVGKRRKVLLICTRRKEL